MGVEAGDLKISVEQPATWARRLTITVPAQRVDAERRNTAQRLAKKVRLPGFRKGKVPAHILEKRFGSAIQQQALEKLVSDAYREALQREGLDPITEGSVDGIDYSSGSDLTFRVDLEVRPQIELERVGGFKITRPRYEVSDPDVDRVIDGLRRQQAVWSAIEGSPAAGDRVVVEIAEIDDESKESRPRRYEIELGAGEALPSIEAAIQTLVPGGSNEFDVELPSNPEDEASPLEPHRIRIQLIDAKRPELPEVDDDFARSVGDFEDLEDLRSKVRADIEKEAEYESEQVVRQQIMSNLIDANPFDLPPSMTNDYLSAALPDRDGVPPQRIAEVRESARPGAERAIKRVLILRRIAELESLGATREEVERKIQEIAERVGRSAAEVRRQLTAGGQIAQIENEITESKVFEYLKSLSTIE